MALLIRHGNPNVELDLHNQLQYHWFCQEETSKPTDLPQEEGETPLHVAVRNGNLAKVGELVANGDPIEAYDSQGMTPLHVAAARGGIEVLDFLAKKALNIEVPCSKAGKVRVNQRPAR
jgi:ankyrin repeat protein